MPIPKLHPLREYCDKLGTSGSEGPGEINCDIVNNQPFDSKKTAESYKRGEKKDNIKSKHYRSSSLLDAYI